MQIMEVLKIFKKHKVMHKPTRVIPEIVFASKNMKIFYNCNFWALIDGSITVPPNTNSKIFPAYSHDIHSLIRKIGALLEDRNSSIAWNIDESRLVIDESTKQTDLTQQ